MIRKSAKRFSEKIMLNQKPRARWWFNFISSRSKAFSSEVDTVSREENASNQTRR